LKTRLGEIPGGFFIQAYTCFLFLGKTSKDVLIVLKYVDLRFSEQSAFSFFTTAKPKTEPMRKSLIPLMCVMLTIAGCDKITDLLTVKAFYNANAFDELACDQFPGVQSVSALDPVNVTFVNNSKRELHINWINYDGSEVSYFDLADGDSVDVPTYLTHVWIIRLTNNACSTILIPKMGAGPNETVTFGEE
jgi:hypothetical protein